MDMGEAYYYYITKTSNASHEMSQQFKFLIPSGDLIIIIVSDDTVSIFEMAYDMT
jgi:hypothetical protein